MKKELFFPTEAALTLLSKGIPPRQVLFELGQEASTEKVTEELQGDALEEAKTWTKHYLIFLEDAHSPPRGDSAHPDDLSGHWWIDI